MLGRKVLALSVLLVSCVAATAKNKKKSVLPVEILQAHTAWVTVDPRTGVDVQDPTANREAIDDVNAALAKWGRLMPVTDPSQADLIIVLRKGNGKVVQPTIGGTPMNTPPPVIGQQTDGGFNASGRTGPAREMQNDPHPQMEVSDPDDTLAVYRGNSADSRDLSGTNPLDAPALWRYTAKDALESPSVPAVDQFRKAIAKSEKALAGP